MSQDKIRHALLLLLEDLERPSLKYIINEIKTVSLQEKQKYEVESLKILAEDSDKLVDLQRKVLNSKVKHDCYEAILYALFNKDNILKNIEALSSKGE